MSIQIKATKEFDGCIDETSLEEADYISIYRGSPGDFTWIADFTVREWQTARKLARHLALIEGREFLNHIIINGK